MTSTSFNIGLGNDDRKTSRVLQPPGGGHTDIFGAESKEPMRGRRFIAPTVSNSGTAAEALMGAPEPARKQPEPEVQKSAEPAPAIPEPEKKAEAPVKTENPQPFAPARVRVPPGGFSTQLW